MEITRLEEGMPFSNLHKNNIVWVSIGKCVAHHGSREEGLCTPTSLTPKLAFGVRIGQDRKGNT